MIRTCIIVAACLLPTTAVAGPNDMFDLVCTGKQQTETGKPAIAWKERLRFNLTERRWCRGACTSAAEIGYISPEEIQISDSRARTGGPPNVQMTLSRGDGTIREAVQAGWSGSSFGIAEGKCVKEPYSGLPRRQF